MPTSSLASEELLSIDTQKAEAPLKFATSDNTFVVDGWVPTKDFERLKDALVKATDDRVYVTIVEPQAHAFKGEVEPGVKEHHEIDAPVAYNNPRAFHDWQTFIDLVARPKYDEIDPTMIFAFVFPSVLWVHTGRYRLRFTIISNMFNSAPCAQELRGHAVAHQRYARL